jgi:hypothetical protein
LEDKVVEIDKKPMSALLAIKYFTIPIIILLLIIGESLASAQSRPGKHKNLGPALIELGYNYSGWSYKLADGSDSDSFFITPFNPIYRKDWRRYGYDCTKGILGWPEFRKCPQFSGPYRESEISTYVIIQVVRLKHNPLNILNNRTWMPTERDLKDIALAINSDGDFAYDKLFLNEHSKLDFIPSALSTGELSYEITGIPVSFDVIPRKNDAKSSKTMLDSDSIIQESEYSGR